MISGEKSTEREKTFNFYLYLVERKNGFNRYSTFRENHILSDTTVEKLFIRRYASQVMFYTRKYEWSHTST